MQHISSPEVEVLYRKYMIHRKINRDFYSILPEEKFDFRMVHTPKRTSDSPRESIMHLLAIEQAYIDGSRTGKLHFTLANNDRYKGMSKVNLLEVMEELDKELFLYLSDPNFDSKAEVVVPWGISTKLLVFYPLIDHEILHEGWNLALMDILDMERFPSLQQVWGE